MSTEAKAEPARSLGVELTIPYTRGTVAAALGNWRGKDGADVVFDTVGRANFAASFDLVASYGPPI